MKVTVDLAVVPIGPDLSLSRYVAACQRVLADAGLKTELHAFGTNVEGEWDAVFDAVRKCHESVHELGATRILTTIKAATRTDREVSLEAPVESVRSKL